MTVKELIEILSLLPQDKPIMFEYDGPDACDDIEIGVVASFDDYILLMENRDK